MKRLVTLALIGALVALPLEVQASHKPTAYCSETGDICQSTRKVKGVRKLRVATAAKYFDRYNLCVTAPDDSRSCKRFGMHKDGPIYKSVVRWSKHFPNKGAGAYTVTWRSGGQRIGKRLGFHVG